MSTWESLVAAKGRYPARNEIDPAALGAKLLPNIFLVDVVETPGLSAPRFRYRWRAPRHSASRQLLPPASQRGNTGSRA